MFLISSPDEFEHAQWHFTICWFFCVLVWWGFLPLGTFTLASKGGVVIFGMLFVIVALCCSAYLFCFATSELRENLATSNGYLRDYLSLLYVQALALRVEYALLIKANMPVTHIYSVPNLISGRVWACAMTFYYIYCTRTNFQVPSLLNYYWGETIVTSKA